MKSAIIGLVVLSCAIGGAWVVARGSAEVEQTKDTPPVPVKSAAPVIPERYPVTILKPDHPRVLTGKFLADGTPESVSCSTCHATKKPNVALAKSDDIKDFHLGLTYQHGGLTCLSCHNPDNYDSLRLADGRKVEFPNVMTLCAQCHGPQHRDYQRGSHGGMNGYWDLTKGPRTRNNCTTCHDPHAPAYPKMMPVFKPLDTRKLSPHLSNGTDTNH